MNLNELIIEQISVNWQNQRGDKVKGEQADKIVYQGKEEAHMNRKGK